MDNETKSIVISRIDVAASRIEEKKDLVARETPVHLFLGSIHLVSILSSPAKLKELVVGHLLGEGLVNSVDDIAKIAFEENRCYVTLRKTDTAEHTIVSRSFSRLIVSSCGTVGYRSLSELLDQIELKSLARWQMKADTILHCIKKLNSLGEIFKQTGGVHVAALFHRDGELVSLAEDVGRHNAVDKVIGEAALRSEDMNVCFLALSGRMTGDIVLKAARVGMPIVASLAAAVDSGLEVARKTGITLIGFVRGNRMNVYTFPRRIKL